MAKAKKDALSKGKGPKDEEGKDEEMDEEQDGEEDTEEDMEKTKKSGCAKKSEGDQLSEDDLQKSLDALEGMSKSAAPDRRQVLLEKAQSSELTKSERDELFELLGKSEKPAEQPRVGDGLKGNDTIQKALDVSDFLQESTGELIKALNGLEERINSSDQRQHGFNLVLAKAVAETGRMVQAVSERLGVIESRPARAPKSVGLQPLQKGFSGQPPAGEELSKSQILDAFEDMIQKGVDLPDGSNILTASTKFESIGAISPSTLQAVQAHIKGAAAH